MLDIPVALVSSLGEAGLKTVNRSAREEETGDFGELAFLGHSFKPASETANPKNVVSDLKERYGEEKVTEEVYTYGGFW